MLSVKRWFPWDRYGKIELCFFVVLWIVMPMLSDLEYSIKEEPSQFSDGYYPVTIIRRIVWGLFMLPPYYAFYRLAIQRLLVKKRYAGFLLSFGAFVCFLEFYMVYVMYGSIANMPFLPSRMVQEADRWRKLPGLHFTLHFLVLELLQMVALAYFIDYERQEKRMQELLRMKTEAELKYLKGQLNPHFFFNTLNNIYSLALQRSANTAPLVAKLSSMMRYVLYHGDRQQGTLAAEITFLQDYMDVQAIRYTRSLNVQFDTQATDTDLPIEPLLLFPFIENAFKHGIEDTGNGYVKVVTCLNGNELILSVENSKTPGTENERTEGGVGIQNTRQRLALLYPGKHELVIRETETSYSVLLTIRITTDDTLPRS